MFLPFYHVNQAKIINIFILFSLFALINLFGWLKGLINGVTMYNCCWLSFSFYQLMVQRHNQQYMIIKMFVCQQFLLAFPSNRLNNNCFVSSLSTLSLLLWLPFDKQKSVSLFFWASHLFLFVFLSFVFLHVASIVESWILWVSWEVKCWNDNSIESGHSYHQRNCPFSLFIFFFSFPLLMVIKMGKCYWTLSMIMMIRNLKLSLFSYISRLTHLI